LEYASKSRRQPEAAREQAWELKAAALNSLPETILRLSLLARGFSANALGKSLKTGIFLAGYGGAIPEKTAMYKECRHIMPSGKKCHSPAHLDKSFCYHHTNLHRLGDPARPAAKELPLPAIEDAAGIQIPLT
jgi:hypothetical protein